MKLTESYHLTCLKEELTRRQAANTGYSLRAFARDLEIDSSNLSAILRKKRNIPASRIEQFAQKLGLTPKEKMLFRSSVFRQKARVNTSVTTLQEKQILIDEIYFRVISEWEYYAFLNLIKLPEFKFDKEWICTKLNITESRLDTIIEHLKELKFIKFNENQTITRLAPDLKTSEDVHSEALQKSHFDGLDMASKKLKEVPVPERDFTSLTFTMNANKMEIVKALIREFYEKLDKIAETGKDQTDVYQINCQVFPITNMGPVLGGIQ